MRRTVRLPVSCAMLLLAVACDSGTPTGESADAANPPDAREVLPEDSNPGDLESPPDGDGAPGPDTAGAPDTAAPPPVVLMSGFEPFGGYETNPSMEALRALEGQVIAGLEVRVVELPVEWDLSWDLLHDAIREHHPRVVVATGMAGSHEMRYEVLAVNEEWGMDNAGVDPKGGPVVPGGPPTLTPDLPVQAMAAAVEHAGFASVISDDAGTYLCNHVMYNLLHYAKNDSPTPLAAGFVHVPPAPYEGPMTVQDITDAHIVGLDVLATWLAEGAPQDKPSPQLHTPPVYVLPGYGG